MNENKKQAVIIYHGNCNDGSCAAYVARKWAESEGMITSLVRGAYNMNDRIFRDVMNSLEVPEENVTLIVVDFSFNKNAFADFYSRTRFEKCVVLDHHASAKEDVESVNLLPGAIGVFATGPGISGATLAWEFFFPKLPVPKSVLLTADRDTWQFALKDTRAFHLFAICHLRHPEYWERVYGEEYIEENIKAGNSIMAYNDAVVKNITSDMAVRPVTFNGMSKGAFLVSTYDFRSDAGNKILDENEHYDFVLIYYPRKDGVSFSLRSSSSREAFDCAKVASIFGGGGHKNAAGVFVEYCSPTMYEIKKAFGLNFL